MAEDALGLSIINLLKTKANHCIELKDISRQLKIHKKELNVELYRLKRQGILNKVQESPPVWQLNSTSSGIHLPLRPKHSRKKYEKEFHRGGKTGGYRHGHSFGQKRKKKTTHNTELINGIIHYLQDKTGPVKSVDIARAVGKSTSSEINPSLYFLQKQNAIMKVLEKPVSWIINSGWKQPYSSSLVDSTLDLTNQKDVLLGQNSGSYNVLNLNTECDDQETPIHFPGFGSMDTLDRSLAIGNQNSPNIDIGGLNMNSPGHEVNVQFGDNDQEHNFPTPSFSDQMFIEEMELGGDIFGSEDNELSKSESDILDSLQDSSDVTEVSKDTEATTSDIDVSIDQSVSELQLPLSSNDNVTDATSSETETDSTAESNSQEPASVLLSVQTEEDESDLVLTEMDELLKAMLNCPMQSAKLFILESKLKYSSGKVTDLLNKCKEKKFVNYHDPLWIMTPFGVDYIKGILAKIGQSSNVKTFFIQPSQPSIPKSTKTTFKGPPPSPFELLQKESSNIKTSLSSSDSNPSYSSISHQKCDHSSVPQALGQSVPRHNIIPSLNQQSSSSSREPVPLMSLNFNSSSSIGRGTEKFNQLQSKDSSSSTNSFPLQEDNISQGSTPKSLMSVDVSPFSSKNVLLNKNELPGRYPVGTEVPGRYPGPGPTQVPGSYPGTGSTGAPGSYPGLGPMQAPGSFPGTSPMQAPGSYPGRYQSPSETTGRYPVSSTVPERYPVPSEASKSVSSSGVFEKDNSSLNLLITRNEQINQIFTKNKDCVPPSSELSKQQSSSGSDTLHSQSQNTGCNLQTNQSTDMDTGVVLPAGHTESEHMPAYAKSILQSFSSGSTRFPTNDKMQQRKGIGQSSMFGRSPFSSSTSSGTINKTITSTSSGFKPPPSPFDLIKQQSNQAGNLHNTNVPPPSNIREDLARTAHQMIQNIPVSQNYVPSGSSSIFQQQPSVSSQIQIQSQLRGSSQMSSNLSGQSQMMGQRLTQPQSFPVMGNVAPLRQKTGPSSLDLTSESFAAVNKNPVSALMEYAQSRHKVARIEVIRQSGPSHRPRFLMGVFIGDQQIAAVECSNKKDGRREVADKALRALIASGQYNLPSTSANKPLVSAANMTHFDKIAALSHQAFNALVAGISENFAGRKVIAALVMKCSDTDVGTVVSVGSGNRCITGQQLSLEGNTVNDSHAEIITRRGFIRFLYKRLLAYDPNNSGDMFEKAPSGKLQIRNGITFHLYISTAPCGDGALFSPRDVSSNSGPILNVNDRIHHPTFTSQAQGLVRTKMEGGEGTIPVEKDFVIQTFDGIQRGERLRTMSCTDKICRWNVVGMQGALLSHFLEPIYLDSLTLGLLYDHGHLARALCCRVAHGEMDVDELLPRGYHLNHPWLGRVTACEPPREVQKTKALSINWCIGDERAEVTDGTLGLLYTKIEKGLFSRCSKKNLYDSFKKLCQKYGLSHLLQAKNYNEAKMMATDFQTAKSAMLKKFKENGYGHWVSKPIEEELFS